MEELTGEIVRTWRDSPQARAAVYLEVRLEGAVFVGTAPLLDPDGKAKDAATLRAELLASVREQRAAQQAAQEALAGLPVRGRVTFGETVTVEPPAPKGPPELPAAYRYIWDELLAPEAPPEAPTAEPEPEPESGEGRKVRNIYGAGGRVVATVPYVERKVYDQGGKLVQVGDRAVSEAEEPASG